MSALAVDRAPATSDERHRLLAFALFALGFALVFRGWLFTGFDGHSATTRTAISPSPSSSTGATCSPARSIGPTPSSSFPNAARSATRTRSSSLGAADAALRGLGLDAFTAFMVVMAAVSAIGFFGFRRLAIRHFGVPPAFAAIGAFLFAFGNLDAVKLIHVQAYCAMLLPVLCDLMLSAWKGARGAPILAGSGRRALRADVPHGFPGLVVLRLLSSC